MPKLKMQQNQLIFLKNKGIRIQATLMKQVSWLAALGIEVITPKYEEEGG